MTPAETAMTPTERRATLDALGWSVRRFANAAGYDEKTCRIWMAGGNVPPAGIDEWLLRRLAAVSEAVAATPPPSRTPGARPRGRGRPPKAITPTTTPPTTGAPP